MADKPHERDFVLRRCCLGLCPGLEGEVYLADPEGRPGRVHVLPREVFVAGAKSRRIRARRWCIAMPRRECLLKRISLPAESDEEARRMLAFEVPGLVPLHNGSLCYDALPLERTEEGVVRYLVFLSPLDRIERAVIPLREAGIVCDAVVPDSVALWRCVRRRGPSEASGLLIGVDARQYQVLVLMNGRLQGAQQMVREPGTQVDLSLLRAEVQRALGRDETDPGAGLPPRVWLVGAGDLAGALAEQWRASCGGADGKAPPVEVLSSEVRVFDAAGRDQDGTSSAIAALCALGCCLDEPEGPAGTCNLAPVDWRAPALRRRRRTEWLKTAALSASVPVLLYVFLSMRLGRLEAQRAAIECEMVPIRDVAAVLETKNRQVRLIQSQLSDRSLPLEVLAELCRRVPEGLSLSHLTMDLDPAGAQLQMKGPAGSLEAAFAFPLALEESPLFTDVRPDAAQQMSRGQGVLIEFGCRCRIEPAASRPMR